MIPGKKGQLEELAGQVMHLAHDELLIHLRFFDVALAGLTLMPDARGMEVPSHAGAVTAGAVAAGTATARTVTAGPFLRTNGVTCYYDPVGVLKAYQREPKMVARTLLHILLHCIFFHQFQYDKLDGEAWDLAADAEEHSGNTEAVA